MAVTLGLRSCGPAIDPDGSARRCAGSVVPVRDWRWWVGGLGRILISIGLLMFAFVAYQLWGTGIETARAQDALEEEFDELLATAPATDAPTTTAPEDTLPDTTAPDDTVPDTTGPETTTPGDTVAADASATAFEIEEGDAIARLEIPAIGVDTIVVAGVEKSDLKRGPGHFPETPLPGQLGNSAIAGHRTTYGQPFFDVDKLQPGDEMIVTMPTGRYVYVVTGQQIVSPSDYQVVATADPTVATLTLTSCHPKWTARERIIVTGELEADDSTGPVTEPVVNYGRPLDSPDDGRETDSANDAGAEETEDPATGGTQAVNEEIADAFSDGWFSDPAANPQVALWGIVLSAIAVGAWALSRRVGRNWVGLVVGIVPFTVALYFFFQNVNRLLPPNL
jgi:sortase A